MRMNVFYIQVDVSFSRIIEVLDSEEDCPCRCARGFLQEFGYTALSASTASSFIQNSISDEFGFENLKSISFDWIGVIEESALEDEIYSDKDIVESTMFKDPTQEGLWYKSGRAFYE